MGALPERVTIVEVGARDGLQNEAVSIPTERKIAFIHKLVEAGLRHIEVSSFVSPQAVPQLADAEEVFRTLPAASGVEFSALVPNLRGLERAIAAGVKRIAVFTAASESFALKNIRMSIGQSIAVFEEVVAKARSAGITARGYLSTAFVCPYEGNVARERVREIAEKLLGLGVDQVSLSDTIGAAAPRDVVEVLESACQTVPVDRIALHFHDTCGTALANVYAGLQRGVTTFDSSAGGLGGCPYAPGASGNLATEDLVYMLERMGIETGVELRRVVEAADLVAEQLGHPLPSRQWVRLRLNC